MRLWLARRTGNTSQLAIWCMSPHASYDLTRITLTVVLIICLLIAGSLWTLLPFLSALIWATTIVVATWPLLLRVQRFVRGRRAIATALMTGVMLAVFIVPFWLAIGVLFDAAVQGVELARTYLTRGIDRHRRGSKSAVGGQTAYDAVAGASRRRAASARGIHTPIHALTAHSRATQSA